MKGHVKRAIDVARTLDFRPDEDLTRRGVRVYWHPNSPDERIKLFDGASEPACIAFARKAHQIAETGSQGPSLPRTIGEAHKRNQAAMRLRRERERAAHAARGRMAEQLHQSWQAIEREDNHRRSIERLMMPG